MNSKKFFIKGFMTCLLGISSTACSDYLNILPLNDIVLENYWTDEKDVDNAVTGCYSALESPQCISRMVVWGEMRSDNIISGMSTPEVESQILKGNVLPTNPFASWTCFYQVINRCNTVLYYAPKVSAADPNYTESELKANIAEVKAIRALCYFYLIRTFSDVPFVTSPSIDDVQDYLVTATPFSEILSTLISDLEEVKDDAVRKFAYEKSNTDRITRYGIYAILADMYLWNQDYDNCIRYCDLIIEQKKSAYKENLMTNVSKLMLYHEYPLIKEQVNGTTSGNAYNEIFGTKNSFESIFELNFEENQSVPNDFIPVYYGSSTVETGLLSAAEFLCKDILTNANAVFKKTDCRYLESMMSVQGMYAISKYTRLFTSFNNSASSASAPVVSYMPRTTNYANWILYRFTDLLLMKAEAKIEKAGDVKADSMTSEQSECYHTAFSLISAVYNRANNFTTTSTDTLKYATYAISRSSMEELVLLERQRELLFEGKRWFDLIRLARRDGNNNRLINHAINKYSENQSAIRKKLNSPYSMYFPYSEAELKVNTKLTQNPAYNNESSTSF